MDEGDVLGVRDRQLPGKRRHVLGVQHGFYDILLLACRNRVSTGSTTYPRDSSSSKRDPGSICKTFRSSCHAPDGRKRLAFLPLDSGYRADQNVVHLLRL